MVDSGHVLDSQSQRLGWNGGTFSREETSGVLKSTSLVVVVSNPGKRWDCKLL